MHPECTHCRKTEGLCRPCYTRFDWDWWYHHWRDKLLLPTALDTSTAESEEDTPNRVSSATTATPLVPTSTAGARLLQLLTPHLDTSHLVEAMPLIGLDSHTVLLLCGTLRTEIPGLRLSPQDVFACVSIGELLATVESKATECSESRQQQHRTLAAEHAVWFSPSQYPKRCRWLYSCKELLHTPTFREAAANLIHRHEALHAQMVDSMDLLHFVRGALPFYNTLWPFLESRCNGLPLPLPLRRLAAWGLSVTRKAVAWGFKGSWPRVRQMSVEQQYLEERVSVFRCRSWEEVKVSLSAHSDSFKPPFVIALFLLNPAEVSNTSSNVAAGQVTSSSFVQFIVSHAFSDGYSNQPLMRDFSALYAQLESRGTGIGTMHSSLAPLPLGSSFETLESRFFATIDAEPQWSRPDQMSLRPVCFDGPWISEWAPWVYNHDVEVPEETVNVLRRLQRKYSLPQDVLLLSLVVLAIFRASETAGSNTTKPRALPLTLYTPMRDGDRNDAMIGLFSDWRDVTLSCGNSTTVLGFCLNLAEMIRHRRWAIWDPLQNSERSLVNILPLDEQVHGSHAFQQTRSHDYNSGPRATQWKRTTCRMHHRPLQITLDQESEAKWWILLRANVQRYSTSWCRAFVRELPGTLHDLVTEPIAPVLPGDTPRFPACSQKLPHTSATDADAGAGHCSS